jgi:hypothetical protein
MEDDDYQGGSDTGAIGCSRSRIVDGIRRIPFSDYFAEFGLCAGVEIAFMLGIPAIGLAAISGYMFGAMASVALKAPLATFRGFCWGLILFAFALGSIGLVLDRAAIKGNAVHVLFALVLLAMPVGVICGSLSIMEEETTDY